MLAAAGLYLAYEVADTLLLIFAGVLLASVLDAGTVGLGRILSIGRLWRLAIVSTIFVSFLVLAGILGGLNLAERIQSLMEIAIAQAEVVKDWLEDNRIISPPEDSDTGGSTQIWDYLPAPDALFGHAQTAFGLTTGILANIVIILFLGLFFAANPIGYRDGFLILLPVARRERVGEVLTEAGHTLRWWLLGQLAMMALVAVSISIMLLIVGVPNAILLGVIAGLLNFIPYLGPILAFVPVFLVTMPEGMTMLVLVMGLFTVIQSIEGYLLAPIVQERAVHLPPAWTLAALIVFGALFGGFGVALATPIMAVTRVLILRLYVEDALEKAPKVNNRQ